jgi:hypothetical protein
LISFDRWAEEVVVEPPFGGIEFIEQGYDLRVIEAVITKPLPDRGPVFLLHMGVIVLVIGSATGKLRGMFPAGEVLKRW